MIGKDEGWVAICGDYELLAMDGSVCLRKQDSDDKVIIPRDTFMLLALTWMKETPEGRATALKAIDPR